MLKLNQTYFDAKAEQFHAAFAACPTARTFELLPFLFLLSNRFTHDSRDMVLADVLCGDGHFADAFDGCFRHLYGIDLSAGLLRFFPETATATPVVAALDESSQLLADKIRPDAIISNAGMHHIFHLEEGRVRQEQSDATQVNILLDWARCLPRHGVLVVGDIPDPASAGEFSNDARDWQLLNEPLASRATARLAKLAEETGLSDFALCCSASTVADYVNRVVSLTGCSAKAQPGNWFREIVAKKSIYGHVDHFPSAAALVPRLKAHGLGVEYFDLPTPLSFPSMDACIHFLYQAFAFGSKASGISEIPSATREMIREGAETHLGIHEYRNGAVSVGWRSGYYFIKPSP